MSLAHFIDHTVLKQTTVLADIERVCDEADRFGFKAVCVPPYYVQDAKNILQRRLPLVATVVGFPFGYSTAAAKLKETEAALQQGADEIDMVMNLAAFKSNDLAYLESEVQEISALVKGAGKVLKVIIESGVLREDEIIRCCTLYRHYPVDFLKTSTGYAESGASVEAVRLMRKHLPNTISIKASGGIKTAAFAQELVAAGATRLGCSASVAIVQGAEGSGGY